MAARDWCGPALALLAVGGAAIGFAGCSGGGAAGGGSGAGGQGGGGGAASDGDPDPTITPEARATLAGLRYDDGPPPADPSNRVADDPAARAFGQRLFFDKSFSGRLLEGDNDGSAATLGMRGDAGRVSCAGCHVPESGFVDTRSPHGQVSLAAQWTLRRTPTLLEVAFAPLYNWDGRRDAIWNQALGVMESEREFNSSRLLNLRNASSIVSISTSSSTLHCRQGRCAQPSSQGSGAPFRLSSAASCSTIPARQVVPTCCPSRSDSSPRSARRRPS